MTNSRIGKSYIPNEIPPGFTAFRWNPKATLKEVKLIRSTLIRSIDYHEHRDSVKYEKLRAELKSFNEYYNGQTKNEENGND